MEVGEPVVGRGVGGAVGCFVFGLRVGTMVVVATQIPTTVHDGLSTLHNSCSAAWHTRTSIVAPPTGKVT